jgi:hypothetical protein
MNTTYKKMACFLPGLGTPVSLYYTFTSKELRGTALKGLAILPVALVVVSMNAIVPTALALLAGVYIYWGVIAMAGGWGFLAMLIAWRAIEKNVGPVSMPLDQKQETPELIPSTSVSELIPDLNADSILSGIEQLPEEEKTELVYQIIKKMD